MLLDTTRFPLVFLRADGPEQDAEVGMASLGALLDRGERFVLLTDHLPHDRHDESHEDRKQRTLFFKRNKERLRHFCAGMIIITGGRTIPAPVRLAAKSMGKAIALPFDFVPSESDAVSAAALLLGGT